MEASIFLFEKRVADKLHKPKRREMVTEILRRDVKILSQLKHPKILRVIHPLEECHDSVAFATEPVLASLANLMGHTEKTSSTKHQDIKDHSFLEIEIKYGILQIAEALWYLHSAEHRIHGNVCPSSIVVTKRGMWKIAGFGFSERTKEGKQDVFTLTPWSSKCPKMAQPDLDFMAPEIQLETSKHATVHADIFSLGITICAIFNKGQSLLQSNHNSATYAKKAETMTEQFGEVAHKMPLQLVEPVEKMINRDIRYRPLAQHFTTLRYFDDLVVRCMQMMDAVESKDLSQKIELFTKLAQAIPHFPKKLLCNCVFPMLCEQLDYNEMLVLVLPSFLSMIEHADDNEFRTLIQPQFRKIFSMTRPVQATIYLLEKLDVLMAKATEEDIQTDILPMIFSMLDSNSIQGQEAAINVFSTIKKHLDDKSIRKLVLPKAKNIFYKSTNVRTRVNALSCIDRLLDSLDKMLILDEVLPFLTEIQCQDTDIIMSVIAIYRHMLNDKKYGLTQNLLATKVMPTLIPYTAAPGLDLQQFDLLMQVLRDMLDQIDRQRRTKMQIEAPGAHTNTRRTSMQQMYYLASRTNAIRLPEEYLMMSSLAKRPSLSSNSSLGSVYSLGRHSPRRTSIDMRYMGVDPPKISDGSIVSNNKYNLLSVDEAYYNNKLRRKSFDYTPSTPELITRASSESLCPKTYYRRHSSFQGLGSEEQAVLDKIVRDRRASLSPNQPGNPHILVSQASNSELSDAYFLEIARRASTQSMGPVVVPEPGRRDSHGRLLDLPSQQRRSSFQGICESAMQFFVGK